MSIIKEVLASDGFEADYGDVNSLSRYLRAQIYDGVLGAAMRSTDEGESVPDNSTNPFCIGNSGAPYPNGSARTLTNLPGILLQQPGGGATGDDAVILAYYLAQDELLQQFAVGDASHDRWDLVCVKLDMVSGPNVTRDFQDAVTRAVTSSATPVIRAARCQVQVIQGTPAPTPVEPTGSVPAGYVVYAAVKILQNQTTATISSLNIRDYRMPVGGFRAVDVLPPLDVFHSASEWNDLTVPGMQLTATAPTNQPLFIPRGISGWSARLIGVGFAHGCQHVGTGRALVLGPYGLNVAPLGVPFFAGVNGYPQRDMSALLDAAAAGVKWRYVSLSGEAWWSNGMQAGYAARDAVPGGSGLDGSVGASGDPSNLLARVAMQFTPGTNSPSAADQILAARFFFAGAL